MDQEAPPNKGVVISLDDDDSDEPMPGRNKGKSAERENKKDKAKKQAKAASLREKIYDMMKWKETIMAEHLKFEDSHGPEETTRKDGNVARTPGIWEDGKLASILGIWKAQGWHRGEEACRRGNKVMTEFLAKENNVTIMDLNSYPYLIYI
jgi:hypothetical protein